MNVEEDYFKKALYMFDIGQNDLDDALYSSASDEQVVALATKLMWELNYRMKRLYDAGARNFWVHNTGPLRCLPRIIATFGIKPSDLDEHGCVVSHNRAATVYPQSLMQSAVSYFVPSTFNMHIANYGVVGDGFMVSGVTFRNTAGPDAHQAVAFRSDSDLYVIENCEFIGNQDTLYVHSLRQFYNKCRIQGNVNFIFGNSASVFQDCQILAAPRQLKPEKGEDNAVTAHGRTDPAQSTGLVFQNCLINGTDEYMRYYYSKPKVYKNYLGRPWKEFSRTVFINCVMEALITPNGWMPWKGDFALKTLFYGEFGNYGP